MTPLWDRSQNIAAATKAIATDLGESAVAFFHAVNLLTTNDIRVREQSSEAVAADTFVLT
jgi:hypothetical protein